MSTPEANPTDLNEFLNATIRGTEENIVQFPSDKDYWTGYLNALQAVRKRFGGDDVR
jgi:hypothetical protein